MEVPALIYQGFAGARPFHAALIPVQDGVRADIHPHRHVDFHEMIYVLEGAGTCRTHGHDATLLAGDLMLARPSDVHEFSGSPLQGLTIINVAFPSAPWRAFTDLAGVDSMRWDRATDPPMGHEVPGDVEDAFRQALTAHARGPRQFDLLRLWTSVVEHLSRTGGLRDTRPQWLVAACSAMNVEENLREGLPCLLRLAAVSHGHLARCMSQHYGQTPVYFLNERRLAHAAVLLSTTVDSIGQIAQRCGYGSQSYFDRQFRRAFGCSPRAYRESARRAVIP